MERLTVIKVGGAVVENETTLAALLERFKEIAGHKILVHGGGRSATAIASELGIESRMVDGRRITDGAMLRVVTMVYGGLVNKTIVSKLQGLGIDAIGLTGADLDIIRSDKRPVKSVDYGFVGDVRKTSGEKLSALVSMGATPVIAPLTHDGRGQMLNTNADTIAAAVAASLTDLYEVTLTYCFEKPGVLRDAEDDSTVIPKITSDDFAGYVTEGVISGGMIPKIENALQAVKNGVKRVRITSVKNLEGGTTIE